VVEAVERSSRRRSGLGGEETESEEEPFALALRERADRRAEQGTELSVSTSRRRAGLPPPEIAADEEHPHDRLIRPGAIPSGT